MRVPAILVVDDDYPSRRTLTRPLERAGHIHEAANDDEGLQQVSAHPLDLVIVDLMMPEKDGIDTILELRRSRPELAIIAVSGGGELGMGKDFLHVAARLGADRVLSKANRRRGPRAAIEESLSSPRIVSGKSRVSPANDDARCICAY